MNLSTKLVKIAETLNNQVILNCFNDPSSDKFYENLISGHFSHIRGEKTLKGDPYFTKAYNRAWVLSSHCRLISVELENLIQESQDPQRLQQFSRVLSWTAIALYPIKSNFYNETLPGANIIEKFIGVILNLPDISYLISDNDILLLINELKRIAYCLNTGQGEELKDNSKYKIVNRFKELLFSLGFRGGSGITYYPTRGEGKILPIEWSYRGGKPINPEKRLDISFFFSRKAEEDNIRRTLDFLKQGTNKYFPDYEFSYFFTPPLREDSDRVVTAIFEKDNK